MAKESEQKVQELQFLEQNFQNILLQKQAFELELGETNSAMEELETSNEEVYKIIGQLMIKTEKNKVKNDLSQKLKLIELRIKTLDKQEKSINDRIEIIKKEIFEDSKK
ncbi:MAG: prefoldin subunit beta [archaeon]|nr:prefoldin subunit beta [archaeon]